MQSSSIARLTACLLAILAVPGYARSAPGASLGAFEITRFEVDGNTLLNPAAIQASLAGFTGKDRNFDSVEHAIAALEGAYRKRGFGLVKVILPEQELNQGVVHLKVVETRLGKVRVEDNHFHSAANVERSLPAVAPGAIPNTDEMAANLRMANENPSKKATLQLQSAAEPGVVDASVQVVDTRSWSAGALLDNSGTGPAGRTHLTAQYQNFDVAGLDHVFSMQYTTTPANPGKISVYGAGYHIPFYSWRNSLDVYGSYSNIKASSVSAGLLDLTVSGAGTVLGTHFTHELMRIGHYDSQITVGFDRKAFRNDIQFQGTQLGGDVTVDPLSLSYIGQWDLPAGNVNFYVTGVRNIPGGSQASDANFTAARYGAQSDYSLLRYGAGFSRPLPYEWQMRLTLNGQATRDALVPGEQFGVGGASTVRGLQERELSDDKGFTANAELYTPNLCAAVPGATTRCTALAFFDDGHLTRNNALPGEESHETVNSAGIGFRLTSGRALSLQVDYGRVVSATNTQQRGEQRLHALLALAY
jgi:hemolysin activation/secretion protein